VSLQQMVKEEQKTEIRKI